MCLKDLISGNVNKVHYQKGERDEFNHMYDYDANNRLIRAFTSQNEDVWEMDAKYFYYLHGALARRELGENKVQGTDYAYNLQGWLKGVNSTTLDANRDLGKDGKTSGDNQYFGVDAFGFNLNYFQGDYIPIDNTINAFSNTDALRTINGNHGNLYNGNITHMVTAIRKTDESILDILGNNYKYDQLQRIKEMNVYATATQADLQTNNNFTGAALYRNGAFKESYSFDKNGNLKTLTRNGFGVENTTGVFEGLEMDDFKYVYNQSATNTFGVFNPEESNQLQAVQDLIANNNGYTTDVKNQGANNYEYDASGQLIKDVQEEIEKIEWTVTGKVKRITYTSTSTKNDLMFVYSPMDIRVAKIVYNNDAHTEYSATYYAHDGQGNPMSTYTTQNFEDAESGGLKDKLFLSERYIYGSSRLGTEQVNKLMALKQEDLAILPLDNPIEDYVLPLDLGTFRFADGQNVIPHEVLDYNDDGKMDIKVIHPENPVQAGSFSVHIPFETVPGESYTMEYDVYGVTTNLLYTYVIPTDAPFIETNSSTPGHYKVNFVAPVNSPARMRFKFYCIQQGSTLSHSFIFGNIKLTGAGNPWGKVMAPALPVEQEELIIGDKRYELSNHLGSVNVVVSDRKVPLVISLETVYSADVLSYSDYSPFGVQLENRHGGEDYHYAFNGKEKDDEIKGDGNSYDFGARMYDPRIAKWASIDSKVKSNMTTYGYCRNNPGQTHLKINISNVDK